MKNSGGIARPLVGLGNWRLHPHQVDQVDPQHVATRSSEEPSPGSKCPTTKALGPNYYTCNGFWDFIPSCLVTWIPWVCC